MDSSFIPADSLPYLYLMSVHETFMRRCLYLAELGMGSVAPNPMVGSVLVYKNKIIGEGFHEIYGQAHAEVNCIHNAEQRFQAAEDAVSFDSMLQDSTIYVSLEPCAHFGKTPPCADLIISKNIPRVIVGCRDPFPLVNGKGIEKLKAAGIDVVQDVLVEECRELNKRFFASHRLGRPFVILKWAESMDGLMASAGEGQTLISNDISNRIVHKWRSEEAAILVGTKTALTDNPSLTNRHWAGGNPLRVLIDMDLKVPLSANIFDKSVRTIVFNAHKNDEEDNLLFFKIDRKTMIPEQVLTALFVLNIQSLIIEGGGVTLQSFIDAGLWDEARVITALDLLLEDGTRSPILRGAELAEQFSVRNDTISFYNRRD